MVLRLVWNSCLGLPECRKHRRDPPRLAYIPFYTVAIVKYTITYFKFYYEMNHNHMPSLTTDNESNASIFHAVEGRHCDQPPSVPRGATMLTS